MTKVYKNFDQDSLDKEYLIANTVPRIEPFLEKYKSLSAEARDILDVREDVAYGSHPDEVIDIFPAGKNSPIFIFIHGGYWRMLSHKESSFMAQSMVKKGIMVIAVNYSLVGSGATITQIVHQCRAAIAWIWHNAKVLGGNPHKIFVGGSSAGGHLTGMMLAGGWHNEFNVPENILKGAVPLSGLHDLRPVQLSCVNDWAKMDVKEATRNSPLLHLPKQGCPVIISYGTSETSEFKRQSEILANAWRTSGWKVDCFEHPNRNHFDIVFDLTEPKSLLGSRVFEMIAN